MSLIHFNYLRKQRILTLILILALTSTLFAITAYSFLGFYNGFTDYIGEGEDTVAIYSKVGSTPFTGTVPLAVTNQIAQLTGVVASSPEAIAPCTINYQSVFVRGILPKELAKINPITMVEGDNVNINDAKSAIVGKNLSHRLNLNVGDETLVLSVLSQGYVQLQVKGVFQSQSSLDDELIVPLYIGQWLRGLSYTEVTLVRVKIDPDLTSASQLYKEISNAAAPPKTSPSPTPKSEAQQELETLLPLTQSTVNIGIIGIQESQQFMINYLNRYGISRDTLIILSTIVLIFGCGTAMCAITLFLKQHSVDIAILRSIGVPRRKLKIDLALRALVWVIVATVLGTLLSGAILIIFQQIGYIQVLSHTINFQFEPLVVVTNFLLLTLLTSINIAYKELKP
jgi:ABC-type lipoprotein release transport system permease subunit